MNELLRRLLAERDSLIQYIDQTLDGTSAERNEGKQRDLSPSEKKTLSDTRTRMAELDEQIVPLQAFEEDRARGADAARDFGPDLTPQRGAPGYQQQDQARSSMGASSTSTNPVCDYSSRGQVIVDQIKAAGLAGRGQGISDTEARDRLIAAGVTPPGATDDQIRFAHKNAQAFLKAQDRATQVSGDTPGIIPVPIIGEVMSDVDGARPFIDSVGSKALDFAGETFKRPLITQHVAMGKQTTQATSTGLGTQKMIIGSVTFNKETWGGWLDVSRQDIDWTSPSAWDSLLNDFTEQYGLVTENAAGDAFAAAVAAGNTPVEVAGTGAASTLNDYAVALYAAAALAYAGAGRLPDTIWMSLDMWGALGPKLESAVQTMMNDMGSTNIGDFQAGNLLKLPRVVVPSFPAGTIIVGSKRWTEVYEERIGLLQAVNPSILGVQIAYGGYIAYNTIKPTAFCKVVNAA